MYKEMSKGKAILFVITCWLTSFMVMWQVGELVVVNELYEVFPNSANIVTAMISWTTLLTAVSSLVAGSLLNYLSTKTELIISAIAGLFMIVAPIPENAFFMLACNLIAAIGAGFSNTAGMSIISEVFIDENKRFRHMGFYNAVMALIGAICSFVAGLVAANGWKGAFVINFIAIPMLIMTILFIPNIKPSERILADTDTLVDNQDSNGKGFGMKFWVFFISTFLFFVSYVPISTLVSVYVAENNFGGTAFAGTCASLGTVGSFCMGLLFGTIYEKLNRKLGAIIVVIDVALYLYAILLPSNITAIIVCLLLGVSYGAMFSLIYAYAAEIVPISKNGLAMGIMTFDYALGTTVGVYLFQYLMGIMGTLTNTLWISLGLCVAVFVIEFIANILTRKK